jgi:hypothetical protein
MENIFDILTGRPASGKSEIIDFLTRLPARTRREDRAGHKRIARRARHQNPHAVFENEDDVTTGRPDLLPARLETALGLLCDLRRHP